MPKPAKWGRTETIIWPPHKPIYTYGAIFLAFIATGVFLYLRFANGLTPLQHFSPPYSRRPEAAGARHKTHNHHPLPAAGRPPGLRFPPKAGVAPAQPPPADGKSLPLELTPSARA